MPSALNVFKAETLTTGPGSTIKPLESRQQWYKHARITGQDSLETDPHASSVTKTPKPVNPQREESLHNARRWNAWAERNHDSNQNWKSGAREEATAWCAGTRMHEQLMKSHAHLSLSPHTAEECVTEGANSIHGGALTTTPPRGHMGLGFDIWIWGRHKPSGQL